MDEIIDDIDQIPDGEPMDTTLDISNGPINQKSKVNQTQVSTAGVPKVNQTQVSTAGVPKVNQTQVSTAGVPKVNQTQVSTAGVPKVNHTQVSTAGVQKASAVRTASKKKNSQKTGHQILEDLKLKIENEKADSTSSQLEAEETDTEKADNTITAITDLKKAKNYIKKRFKLIDNYCKKIDDYCKRNVKAIYEIGMCFRKAKKICKKKNKTFKNFLKPFKTLNGKQMTPATAKHYIRIYHLFKEYPKFLHTTESYNYYIINHKKIRDALIQSPDQAKYWAEKD